MATVDKKRSSIVWLAEISCEALGTALWLQLLGLLRFRSERLQLPRYDEWLKIVVGTGAMVLIEFVLTGYVLTTLLAALFLPRRNFCFYPAVCSGLYLIHSAIFLIALGNHIFESGFFIAFQLGGACLTFLITLAGDRLRRTLSPTM